MYPSILTNSYLVVQVCKKESTHIVSSNNSLLTLITTDQLRVHYYFVQHASAAGWEIPTLISQYSQGLKRGIQMGLIVSRTTFATIKEVASLALELDTAMSGAETGTAPTKQKIDPDAMDVLVLNGQLSDSEKARMMGEASVSNAEYRATFPANVRPRREKAAGTPGLRQWRIKSAN
ncbi:hypothetical protein PTTG_04884 [Puccinia triticina 1-1 BBBD Race 1]|uniref:Uncharacterized protein n=1 Tax=Puccinia triticina (isolate 1-1 / race 1 (BBBD)) TaxID=630390 RepID=A0A180GV60_PUCT1|nr:hypothetical protein PTTG_04884 [Puccinia triticina 1-1 BBBD Race 1]